MPTPALYGLAYGDKLKLCCAREDGTPGQLGLIFARFARFVRFVRGSAHLDLPNLFDLLVPIGGNRCPSEAEMLEFDLILPLNQASWNWQDMLECELGQPQAWLRRM